MATILPTGETSFTDNNGVPLAGGQVFFYIPGTTTPKDTWQNAGQSILNSNPVTLDASGRAIIYGSGSYRQVVQDSLGNLIWDQDTAEPNAGSVSFGGTSAGTANAQTLSAGSFSFIDGQIISFVAGLTNTGAMTISVGGGAPIPVVKNGTSGPVALVANDIVAGNSYFIQYSAALASFQLLLSVAPALPTGTFLTGYLWGLTLSNDTTDAINDIDIAVGYAASDGATPVLMTLSSILIKRSDASWAVGSGNGWLDTGTIANGTYHVFIIQRSDTGVVDSLLSLSPTTPTMPTSYDRKRRIGSIIRASGAIVTFKQNGDQFKRSPVTDRSTPSGMGSTLITLSVPTGVKVRPLLLSQISSNTANTNYANLLGDGDSGSANITYQQIVIGATATTAFDATVVDGYIYTDTSARIFMQVVNAGGSLLSNTLVTRGWYDDRGRV